MTIEELWKCYNDNLGMIGLISNNNEIITREINQAVASQFKIERAMMTQWNGCLNSPTKFCFINPQAENPRICLFCGEAHE